MQTSPMTTYILLERGVEDKALLADINRVFADLGESSVKKIAVRYPQLLALRQGLQDEMEFSA